MPAIRPGTASSSSARPASSTATSRPAASDPRGACPAHQSPTHRRGDAMTASKPLVIDIYYGDPVQDFDAVKAFGIVGVIHKATEGTAFDDKLYADRRKAFVDIG